VPKVSSPFETLSSSAPTVRLFAVADEKISELEKLVEQLRGELGKEKKTICQLLSDGHMARLGFDKKIADLVKSQDKEIYKLERIITQKHRESVSQAERIDKLERIITQKDKKIKELEKDPSDAELDIRAKEGSKKHAEAKAKLQKLYDERPIISLMDGESIGDLLVNKMISDLIISM
jgi:chromosome segregation ATPase